MKTEELREKTGRKAPIYSESNVLYFNKPCDETELHRKFNPTWIHSKKKHVEKDSSHKDSPERERAGSGQRKFSVEKPEHGSKFMDYSSCRTQTQSETLSALNCSNMI